MTTTLGQLAKLVNGQLVGDADLEIAGAATLHQAQAGDISFVDDASKTSQLDSVPASAAVIPRDADQVALPVIQVDDVHVAIQRIIEHFRPPREQPRVGVCEGAIVSPTAQLGADVDIHPGTTIGDDVRIGAGSTIHCGVHIQAGCQLGENVTIYPNVVLYQDTRIGPRCTIHAGAVIGADGFGYQFHEGRHQLCAQLGCVEIGADVEIGAGSTIDRGTYGPTTVGEGTKIDNLVMIGHNCRIGRHNLLCSQVGIAGSTSTGDYVVMAGQVGVRDHVHIGQRAVLGAKAGIPGSLPDDARVFGSPATPERDQKMRIAALGKLPAMRREFKALVRQMEAVQQRLDELTNRQAAA